MAVKLRLFPWGKVPEWLLPWYSALPDTPRETMNELSTLTLMSDKGLKSEDSVMSSLSSGSCRHMGPLYVRLTVRSGCIEEFRSRELPGERKLICHSETKRRHTYPSTSASANSPTRACARWLLQSELAIGGSIRPLISDQSLGIRSPGFHSWFSESCWPKSSTLSSLYAVLSKSKYFRHSVQQLTQVLLLVQLFQRAKRSLWKREREKKQDVLQSSLEQK